MAIANPRPAYRDHADLGLNLSFRQITVTHHTPATGFIYQISILTNESRHLRIDTQSLPDGETVLAFMFADLGKHKNWWLVIDGEDIDLCTEDPGKDVDLYLAADLRTMIEVWQGDIRLEDALRDERILATGARRLRRSLPDWFLLCSFAGVKSVV